MNIQPEQAERLLRKAPRLSAPQGLLEKLKADIDLPALAADRTPRSALFAPRPSFLRRWLPALSVAVWLLACVVMLAVQSTVINRLRSENEDLRAVASQSEQKTVKSPGDDLAKLRADNDEVRKLRAEIAQLTEQLKALEALRSENQRLLAEVQSLNAAAPPQDDFVGKAAAKAELMKCINNMKQVCLGARMWSNDHGDVLPSEFREFEKYMGTTKILFCPSGGGTTQYEIVSPGVDETDPWVVYLRCPNHPAVGLCDGSVQQIGNRKLVVREDGKTVIGR